MLEQTLELLIKAITEQTKALIALVEDNKIARAIEVQKAPKRAVKAIKSTTAKEVVAKEPEPQSKLEMSDIRKVIVEKLQSGTEKKEIKDILSELGYDTLLDVKTPHFEKLHNKIAAL